MDNHITLTLQALFAPLFNWLPATPAFAREDVWLIGLCLGLFPWAHTLPYSPMGVMVRSVRKLCLPLDQPAGSLTRNGLTTALIAAGMWAGIGWGLSWLPTGGGQGLGIVGLILHIFIIASLCNLSAVPFRAFKASSFAHQGNDFEAQKMILPLVGGEATHLNKNTIHRRSMEAMIIWFTAGIAGGSLAYLMFGLPGLLGYTAIRTVARYVDRRGYGPEQATGPVVLEGIAGYAAGYLAAILLAVASITTPGAHVGRMTRGLMQGLSLRGRGRDQPLAPYGFGPRPFLSSRTHFDVQFMGPDVPPAT